MPIGPTNGKKAPDVWPQQSSKILHQILEVVSAVTGLRLRLNVYMFMIIRLNLLTADMLMFDGGFYLVWFKGDDHMLR